MQSKVVLAAGAALGVLVVVPTRAFAIDYSVAGPLTYTETDIPNGTGGSIGGHLVVPDGAGPFPLIVASHGFSASGDQQEGWAQHYATYGFVAAAPSFPNTISPDENVDSGVIQALVTLYSTPGNGTPADGKVDGTKIGLEGHSAGGLATTLASVAISPTATVLFDPVDANMVGQDAFPMICSPVLGIFADASSCNNEAGWSAFRTTSAGPAVLLDVIGSTHCDGEDPPRAICGPVCGGAADATRQAVYARYATAFFLTYLQGDQTAAATLTMSSLAADTSISNVDVKAGTSCSITSPADAGGGGNPDASTATGADSGAGEDGGRGSGNADAGGAHATDGGAYGGLDGSLADASGGNDDGSGSGGMNAGCGCRIDSSGEQRGPLPWLAIAGAAAVVAARRRRLV
jgi:MYXO-CTERM domain-containing protein